MKTPKARKQKTRLPSLAPKRLEQISQMLRASAIIPPVAQDAVMQSLIAATNPNAESPNAVIASLDRDDRESVRSAQMRYAQTMGRMNMRGRMALLGMSDAEFEAALGQTDEDTDGA